MNMCSSHVHCVLQSLCTLLYHIFCFFFPIVSEGVTSINSALSSSESSTLLGTLTNEHVGLEEVDCGNCPHYATLMTAALTAKIEVSAHLKLNVQKKYTCTAHVHALHNIVSLPVQLQLQF